MEKVFSVDKIIEEKGMHFFQRLPNSIQLKIKSLLYETEVNRILSNFKEYNDIEFINKIIEYFNISIEMMLTQKLDKSKKYIFVCNHPTGILDGIIILKTLLPHFNCKIISNDIISYFKNIDNLILPINWFGNIAKKQAIDIQVNRLLKFPRTLA